MCSRPDVDALAFAVPSGTRPTHHYDELGSRERYVRLTGYGR
ncbi:MAG: hypothetical protein QM714_05420 [Nocardioides sp.]